MNTKNYISAEYKEINEKEKTIIHYISTSTPDRYNDIVNPAGIDYADFRKNPVVFFGHRSNGFPIGKNIWLKPDGKGVIAKTQFDSSDAAGEVFRLNKEGFLNSWSIGFIPKGSPKITRDENTGDVYNLIDEWSLLEYSSVALPANPDCVNLMMKELKCPEVRKILETENEKLLNSGKFDLLGQEINEVKKALMKLEDRVSEKLIQILKLKN